MTSFVYILSEGVQDVALLGKLLVVLWAAKRVDLLDKLGEAQQAWMRSFKWPSIIGKETRIFPLSVAAPVFYQLPTGIWVALRNAEGLTKIKTTLERDLEAFSRRAGGPDTLGIVLDSDDEEASARFQSLAKVLVQVKLSAPATLGAVAAGPPRVGVFALPEPGKPGTIEDVLISLGSSAYPGLCAAAQAYAEQWRKNADSEPDPADWRGIRKPAGVKKATIGAMTAILKPGKAAQASIEDNRWVSEKTKALPAMQPCLAFLASLLDV